MTDFNFYKAKEIYREKYFQLPKVFFTNEKYKSMSNDVKIAYAILKDRFEYSIANNWVDENNNIYFIFTQPELMDMLNCKSEKLSKIKKELEKSGLLYQKRGGFKVVAGKQKNLPNLMYLGKPEVTAQDVFMLNKNEFDGYSKIEQPQKKLNNSLPNGYSKIEQPSNTLPNKESDGYSKIEHYLLDSNDFDTNDTNDTNQRQEKLLLDIFVEQADNLVTQGLSKDCLTTIATFSESLDEAQETIGTIIKAKAVVQKQEGQNLSFEEWDTQIHKTLRDVYFNLHKKKKQGNLKSSQAFIYRSMSNLFTECANQILLKTTVLPEINVDPKVYQ